MSTPFEILTGDYKLAYQAAGANPGKTIDFDGQLPSGFFAQQKIVAVPPNQNAFALADQLSKKDFAKASSIIVSSSEVRGTHIIATFGGLEKRAPSIA